VNTRKKILIVDDEAINVEFFDLMLSKLGFLVEKAQDGVEGLEKVKRFVPDLIILDNIMPRMSGWEFTKILKSDPRYKDISIIMLSALDDIKDKIESFEMGVEDYITKPFNFSEVLARIRVVLRTRELITQISLRESRLNMAEELGTDIKKSLLDFAGAIDELDNVIAGRGSDSQVVEKTQKVRRHIAELDARIEKTLSDWEAVKKDEIGLSALEDRIRRSMNQE
jgi:CheY-like chemotaxis protein